MLGSNCFNWGSGISSLDEPLQGWNDQVLKTVLSKKIASHNLVLNIGISNWGCKGGLTSPGHPCAPKSKPQVGWSRNPASSHQEHEWSCTWVTNLNSSVDNDMNLIRFPTSLYEGQIQFKSTYLPPSEVTTSLHWHCSISITSFHFVGEPCPVRCAF